MFEALLIIAFFAFLAYLGVFKLLGAVIGVAFELFGTLIKLGFGVILIIMFLSILF